MSYIDFDLLFVNAPGLYLLALVISAIIYLPVIRLRVYSIFDPLGENLVFSVFASAIVVFLALTKQIENHYLIHFAASELLFLAGLTAIRKYRQRTRIDDTRLADPEHRRFLQSLYLLSACIFIISQGAAYATGGIPLFYESRLDYYAAGGGFGFLSRVISISSFFCWYLLIYRFAYRWKIGFWPKIGDIFVLASLSLAAVLSGSKSTFIYVLFLLFYFRLLHRNSGLYLEERDRLFVRGQKVILAAAVAGAVVVLLSTGRAGGISDGLYQFYYRVVLSGDGYFMGYPNSMLLAVDSRSPFLAVFGGSLNMLRLVTPDQLPEPLGFQLFHLTGGLGSFGPNPRHNLFGLVYFGAWTSLFYSAFLGLFVGLVRNVGIRFVRLGGASELIYVFLAISVIAVNADLVIFVSDVTNLIVVGIPLLLGARIFSLAAQSIAPNNVNGQPGHLSLGSG